MDYGKEKFGGPFTEEEVEDVKTVLRLIPLVICLSLCNSIAYSDTCSIRVFNFELNFWLIPVMLIPLLVCLCFRNHVTNMLRCITIALLISGVGFVALQAMEIYELVSDDVQKYISCGTFNTTVRPVNYVEWYWKVGPCLLYRIAVIIVIVLTIEFMISQSPDKMKAHGKTRNCGIPPGIPDVKICMIKEKN